MLEKVLETDAASFVGLAMCPRDPSVNDNKATICAELFQVEQSKQNCLVERVYSCDNLSLIGEKEFVWPAQYEDFIAVKLGGSQAYIGFEGHQVVLVIDD